MVYVTLAKTGEGWVSNPNDTGGLIDDAFSVMVAC
jgi:hypothetical protein